MGLSFTKVFSRLFAKEMQILMVSFDAAGKTTILYKLKINDRDRVVKARDELHRMLNVDELRDVVLLVFANKQDLPNALNAAEITNKLGLHSLRQRHWYIQSTCAPSGEGLYKGLDWLSNNIANRGLRDQ